jgi:hypothetical protein
MSDSSQPKDSLEPLLINGRSLDDIIKECTIDLAGAGASMNDDITITAGGSSYNYATSIPTITLGPTGSAGTTYAGAGGTYTISTLSTSDTITLTGIDNYSAFNIPKEWVDCLPPLGRVEDMCKKYPGLKIAFDNFKVFYEMVKDDYDNPVPKK